MLVMIFVLAACAVWLEMRVVNSCSPLGNLLEKTRVGSALFSLLLSVGLGWLFGADGLIIFASGIVSTVAIQPWYAARKSGVLVKVRQAKQGVHMNLYAKKDLYVRRGQQVWAVSVFLFKALMLPFVVIGKIMDVFADK